MLFKPYASEVNYGLSRTVLTFELPTIYNKDLENLFRKGSKKGYELKPVSEKRSLNANAYMWVLLDQIAQAIHGTKEEVYRIAVKHVGVFDTLSSTGPEEFIRFREKWESNGLGWFVEMVDEELLVFNAYYGSSRYNKEEMNALIDYVVQECKELGIETKDDEEINSLIKEWGDK